MPFSLTVLIVDDEPLARQELQFLLEADGDVQILAQGANGIEAVDLIRTHRPDVLFLDVHMPGLDGFAVLKKALAGDRRTRPPQVVFATAFDQYAVRAFEVNAVDYLLKPFDSKRLNKTLEKVRARLASSADLPEAATPTSTVPSGETNRAIEPQADAAQDATLDATLDAKLDAVLRMLQAQTIAQASGAGVSPLAASRSGKVVVRSGSRLLLVDQREICFATTDDGQISVVTKNVEGIANVRTLDELMDQLDPDQFWRPHRSYVVNLQHIREVLPWFKGNYQLRMDDRRNTEIPVSRMQTKRLRELFSL